MATQPCPTLPNWLENLITMYQQRKDMNLSWDVTGDTLTSQVVLTWTHKSIAPKNALDLKRRLPSSNSPPRFPQMSQMNGRGPNAEGGAQNMPQLVQPQLPGPNFAQDMQFYDDYYGPSTPVDDHGGTSENPRLDAKKRRRIEMRKRKRLAKQQAKKNNSQSEASQGGEQGPPPQAQESTQSADSDQQTAVPEILIPDDAACGSNSLMDVGSDTKINMAPSGISVSDY